ncbi:MAG: AAA family ATPase [Lachnospiraceae bacterium]|nr:AAA family ATPase [Lachnospiraceae bacterium]MCM1231571.1 AAA family ATPase [Ruminococcus flavefaciens]
MKTYHGTELKSYIGSNLDYNYRERFLLKDLHTYMLSGNDKKVCCLYGLRRTGKTVMMLQEIRKLNDYDRSLFIHCENGDMLKDIKSAIEKNPDCRYVFVDEATKADNFISASSVLADIYAAEGRKIVLSSTDSLGLLFARYNELFDRTHFINTTYIPFKEYSRLLQRGIMDYIRYGGTLTPENVFYNHDDLNEYSNTAIVYNIANSLKKSDRFHNEGYRVLEYLIEHNELPSFINKVIEYPTREFLAKIINDKFKSHDLGSLADLIERNNLGDSSAINSSEMSDRVRIFLGIKEKPFTTADERSVQVIISYLKKLDVLYQIPKECYLNLSSKDEFIFTQPGMRYCQATELSQALVTSEEFEQYTPVQKAQILKKLDDDICGGILEDIIFYQLSRQFNAEKLMTGSTLVTKYRDEFGREADTVVLDFEHGTAVAIEVKLSEQQNKKQVRHLTDDDFCSDIERKSGTEIINKLVIYRGRTDDFEGVLYINADDFLKNSDKIIPLLLKSHFDSTKKLFERSELKKSKGADK